jgi:stage II sporulation protein D
MRRRPVPSVPPASLGLAALMGLAGCTVAGRPLPELGNPRLADHASPEVRVGIAVDEPTIELATDGRVTLTDAGGRVLLDRGDGPWTVTRSGNRIQATDGESTVRASGSLVVRPIRGRIRVNGTGYRGAVLLRPAASGVTAVNLVDLEAYLQGVLPLEIGAGRPPEAMEAVKAQAVAARTYAVRQLDRRGDLGFDYYGTVLDQAYGGADVEDPVTSRAVASTRGQILTYHGEPIEAFYHSTCGGETAALEEVWNGEPRPYLQSVSDARPGGGWYCEDSSRFRWTEEWDEGELLEALTTGLQGRGMGPITEVRSIRIEGRTPSGRAAELVIRTNAGEARVRGDSIRRVLRPEPGRLLNSTAIELETRGGDHVTGLTVHGSGWGHGIGMCQSGALGRARDGASYRSILSTYYPGTRLVRLYH